MVRSDHTYGYSRPRRAAKDAADAGDRRSSFVRMFATCRFAVNSLTANANLVTKVYFPREIFPISAVLVSLVDFAIGSVVLVGLMAYYQVAPTSALVALPWILVVHFIFTLSISMLLAMANLFYRDVKYLF